MKQYNLSNLVSQTESSLISYLASALPVGNHQNQTRLGERFFALWQDQTFKGPYIESLPNYQRGESLAGLAESPAFSTPAHKVFFSKIRPIHAWKHIESNPNLNRLLRARRQLWPEGTGDAIDEMERNTLQKLWTLPLYYHQQKAFETVTNSRANLIVATGTGSGKTECFLLPLLHELLSEADEVRVRAGVRAILLYPMNALVEDQMTRLRRLLFWINLRAFDAPSRETKLVRPITFGRYTGETRIDEHDRGPDRSVSEEEVHEIGELRYRKEMQQTPPDILVTNFTMLEYMLLRNDDRRMFREPSLFKFLILDEVHSYRGTTGMEVSTLLCRFRNYLARLSTGSSPAYFCIGTSATLGSEPNSPEKLAQFAKRLFGAPFLNEHIIAGTIQSSGSTSFPGGFDALRLLDGLLRLPAVAPMLCSAFAIEETHSDTEYDDSEIPEEEWVHLSGTLHCRSVPIGRLFAANIERTEMLGSLVLDSPAFDALKGVLGASVGGVVSLSVLAAAFWGKDLSASQPLDCGRALGRLIQLIQAARSQGDGLLPMRAHLFVREHRHAYLCIDPTHQIRNITDNDGWWSELFVHHRSNCETCGSVVYPLLLCRKCGFVVLEGWLRKKTGCLSPEYDELIGRGQFRRILFRPLNAFTGPMLDRLLTEPNVTRISICTHCGLKFHHDREEYLQVALSEHAKSCPPSCVIEAIEWSRGSTDVSMNECPYCDQEWFSGQEVVTPPMLSLYAAATVLLEEIKRAIDEPLQSTNSINKVLCFSDSRQQAAFIASRLQRTNEDFTFRQVVYSVMKESATPVSMKTLLSRVTEVVAGDSCLARLFCEPEEVFDDSLVRKRVATLLFRDTCTEYRTLESLGVVSVLYPENILVLSSTFLSSHPLTRGLSELEKRSLGEFILDWTFRFHRWVVSPAPIQLFYSDLEKYGYQERSISRLSGDKYSRTSGFSLQREDSRSRVFDFYRRLCKRDARPTFTGDLGSYKSLMETMWDRVMSQPEMYSRQRQGLSQPDEKPFVAVGGTDAQTLQLKMNWLSLRWRLEEESAEIFRCGSCGYISRGSVRGLCPIRDCSGTLTSISLKEISQETFSPARHYLTLLRTKSPKPLNIEEHTAQISPVARRQIEVSFRKDEKGSIDIISGSTTFELGVDLGTVNGVFLANMPPDVSNYRQRAGRAGRRTGMLPIVLTYVRERPHDSYFWANPEFFIAGPLRVPRFSSPSHEVLLRHVYATVFSFLMQGYPTPTGLQGPIVSDFVEFALNAVREASLREQVRNSNSELFRSIKAVLDSNPQLTMIPEEGLDHFYKRLRHFHEAYSLLVSGDGVIATLSDYGILPSYNYPIYVDELRLYECPRTESPRKDLKLQRDRSISVNEYFPGRVIVAGKVPIRSVGLWKGFKVLPFKYCKECAYIDTRESKTASATCPNGCGALVSLCSVRPLGGFVGRVERGLARQDPELFSVARSQFLFDPAGNPPLELKPNGVGLSAVRQSSFNIEKSGARMRIFVPRPDGDQSLELGKANLRDVGMPGNQLYECLVVPSESNGPRDKYFLMHEFTTDILRLQVKDNAVGKLLLSSDSYLKAAHSDDDGEKRKANTILVWTLTQALAIGGARVLQIDPREIAFTFRCATNDALLSREAILFDTAPGGAGYCDQLYEDLRGLLEASVDILDCKEACGDSCYACLRSFENQAIHSRLNRHFVLEGLRKFVAANWVGAQGAGGSR
jgi:hypothetical protein